MDLTQFMYCEGEKPLDRIVNDGGFFRIFRTVACVGDSLSSGEFESIDEDGKKHYHDLFEYSWGQYMAREAGCKVYNFSKGGMRASTYCKSFAEEKGYWDPELAAQAYIIALGVNDILNSPANPVGSIDDIDTEDYNRNTENYAGYYGKIIQRYKEIQPRAKFFLMTMPYSANEEKNRRIDEVNEFIRKLPEVFTNTYILDFSKYAPVYDENFRRYFYMGGHMSPMGYILTAKMVMSYIDWIVRKYPEDFKEVGFIGTDLRHYPV